MKRKLMFVGLIVMILALLLVPACPAPPAEEEVTPPPAEEEEGPPPTPAAPDVISMMCYDIGSSGYVAYGFIGDAMIKMFGIKLRAVPCGSDPGRMIALRAGDVEFAGQGVDIWHGMNGIVRYTDRFWGPQDLRIVWLAQHAGLALQVRGDSDIYSIADLKGKKCSWVPGSVLNDHVEAMLAYAGLSWDDVVKVEMPGYSPAIRGLIDGTVDAAPVSVIASVCYEVTASPHGGRFIPMPPDEEAIARVRAVGSGPILVPYVAKVGPGLSEDNPLECLTYAYPGTICYPDLDEDIAYWMTKAIHEGYDIMAAEADMMKYYWTLEGFLALYEGYDYAILHEGTVRYLKEIGEYKPGYDKLQADRIEHFSGLQSLWTDVVAEASEKGIADKDFPDYWLERRAGFLGK